jgi:hypothetical protein
VLAFLAIPFWPVALVILGALWLLVWPIERLAALVGLRGLTGWSAAVGRVFYIVLKPWVYLDKRYPRVLRNDSSDV